MKDSLERIFVHKFNKFSRNKTLKKIKNICLIPNFRIFFQNSKERKNFWLKSKVTTKTKAYLKIR